MKLLASLIAALGMSLVSAQTIDITGNLVLPTVAGTNSTPWVNGVYQNQLQCWAPGMPGNCGPNPTVRPGNVINFSYGWTDLYQQQAIGSVLPKSGTGLRINGYEYEFTAKNGNGWDDGRTDLLFAYVQFDRPDGTTLLNRTHNLSYKFDWTAFNFKYNFDTPVASKDVATVRYGFVGQDNNGWAGTYGPEITNVNFNLRYSVDPCVTNPLHSASCSGFTSALANLAPPPPAAPTSEALQLRIDSQIALLPPPPPPGTTTDSTQSRPPEPQQQAGRDTAAPDRASAPSSAPPQQTQTQSSTVSAATPVSRERVESRDSTASGTAVGLAVIQRNREREQQTAATAVTQALATAQREQQAVTQQAESIAAAAVANSVAQNAVQITVGADQSQSRATATASTTISSQMTVGLAATTTSVSNAVVAGPRSIGVAASTTTYQSTAGAVTTVARPTDSTAASGLPASTVSNTVSTTANASGSVTASSVAVETVAAVTPQLLQRTGAMNDIITSTVAPSAPTPAAPRSGPTVNANTADNDAAGGVTIGTMATAPPGFGNYTNFALRDAAFYAPREVYRNQRNVDNQRALRQLTSDSVHRQMVEQQYQRTQRD